MKWRNNKDFQTLAQNRRNINSLGKLQDYTTTTYIKLVLYFSYYQTCSRIKHPLPKLLPCPSTGPKIFWAGPNFLCQTKS